MAPKKSPPTTTSVTPAFPEAPKNAYTDLLYNLPRKLNLNDDSPDTESINSSTTTSKSSNGRRRRRRRNKSKSKGDNVTNVMFTNLGNGNGNGKKIGSLLPAISENDARPAKLQIGLDLDVELELKAKLKGDLCLSLVS